MVNYPYFSDIRGVGIVQESGLTKGVTQVTMTWPSPITLDEKKNEGRKVTRLLESSDQAWTSDKMEIQPNYQAHGKLGFPVGDQPGTQLLAVAVEGSFDSYFKDKPSPLVARKEAGDGSGESENGEKTNDSKESADKKNKQVITRVINRSPDSARIILFASSSFLTDNMLNLASSGLGTRYLKPIQLVENAVDWSLEDRDLLAIRGRAHFSRTLIPMDENTKKFWEYLNYGLAMFGLLLIGLIRRHTNKRAAFRYAAILDTAEIKKA